MFRLILHLLPLPSFSLCQRILSSSYIPWAIAESGNITFITSMRPSAIAKGKLCSAIKQDNIVINALGVFWGCPGIGWTNFAAWSWVLLCRLIAVTSAVWKYCSMPWYYDPFQPRLIVRVMGLSIPKLRHIVLQMEKCHLQWGIECEFLNKINK